MNRTVHVVRGTAAAATAAFLAALLAAPGAQAAPGTRTLYASPDGRGSACTAARPCTPEGARDLARTETRREVRVLLKDGTYKRDEPLRLGAADSGKDGRTVTWTAALGAHPCSPAARTSPAGGGTPTAAGAPASPPASPRVSSSSTAGARSGPAARPARRAPATPPPPA
ncbi:hypothetical protein [Streptomyces sp. RKAG290]|uniref:hypothetical protein n=1 Tax=Streptomyces sp. RKAG290 TaxID=2888348 RepID=UPI0020339613|nr:hypothetical protein [Streptomyces sp. RKAG290]MCM2410333.1 hypothetical protein [Streptomyces sp. RKAG290]